MISYPRLYVKNKEDILLQIIRNEREYKTFLKIDEFRRCLIDDITNYHIWKKGEAPYNQENILFGIKVNYYEAFTS